MAKRVLWIENDAKLVDSFRPFIKPRQDIQMDVARNIRAAMRYLDNNTYDALIVSLMLPPDGERLRKVDHLGRKRAGAQEALAKKTIYGVGYLDMETAVLRDQIRQLNSEIEGNLNMAGGCDILEELARKQESPPPGVVFFSAKGWPEVLKRCERIVKGWQCEWLGKPTDPYELLEALLVVLGLGKLQWKPQQLSIPTDSCSEAEIIDPIGKYVQDLLVEIAFDKISCLYDLLRHISVFMQADSIYVLREKDAVRGDDFVQQLAEVIRKRQSENAPWYKPESFSLRQKRVLLMPVRLRRVFPNRVGTDYLVVDGSAWTGADAGFQAVEKLAGLLYAVFATWAAWAHSRRDERELCFRDLRREGILNEKTPDDEPTLERTISTLYWPMPFEDYLEVLTVGWDTCPDDDEPARKNFKSAWLDRVERRLCLARREDASESQRSMSDRPNVGSKENLAECCEHGALCFLDPDRVLFKIVTGFDAARFAISPDDPGFGTLPQNVNFGASVMMARLDHRALTRFFADVFWRDWVSDWSKRGLSSNQSVSALTSCGYLAQYLLGDIPIDERTIEALVWAVARYGHDVLAIEPRLDLGSHLLQALRVEPALHVLRVYYRDHFFHAIEVCFLGHLLLTTEAEDGNNLLQSCCCLLNMTEKEVLREWYVAALLHDIGYCVEVLVGLQRVLEFYAHSQPLRELTKGVDELLSHMTAALVSGGRVPEFTAGDEPGRDHGAVGAEHLASLIANIRKDKKEDTPEYESARYAIAVHNHRQQVVYFHKTPLAFLLIICDSIQEWNRAHLGYATAPGSLLARLMRGGKPEDIMGPLGRVGLEWDHKVLQFTLDYGPDINRNGGVFRLWLDSTANLQRLRPDDLPFNVRIRFVTPCFGKDSQMDRLMDAALETHMNFLVGWFPAANDGAVKHERLPSKDGGGDYDHLELDLFKLSKKPLITEKMERFWELIPKWSHYSDDRVFAGDYAPANPR